MFLRVVLYLIFIGKFVNEYTARGLMIEEKWIRIEIIDDYNGGFMQTSPTKYLLREVFYVKRISIKNLKLSFTFLKIA